MKDYEDFIKGLQSDIEVPSKVSKEFHKALKELPEVPTKRNRGKNYKGIIAMASAAVVVVFGIGFLMVNPVLAARIPIIGKIFERVEDKVTYSGDFKNKADILTVEPETTKEVGGVTDVESSVSTDNETETATVLSSEYVVEDQGVTFTASEVYCDGHSLYLTAKVESKEGGFTNMTGYANEAGTGERAKHMYAWGGGQTDQGIYGDNTGQSLEGDVIDDNTFVGMMKIDLEQVIQDNGVFDLKLSLLGFDDNTPRESEDIDISRRYDGSWKLAIPYTVDTQNAKTIEVNEQTDTGFDISKVFVSPYQVLVYMEAPYTQPNSDSEIAREQYEELWGEKNEEILAAGDTENVMTYEDWLNDKEYDMDWDIAVFNQDGEKIRWYDISLVDEQWVARCATQGVDISELQIFIDNEWLSFKMGSYEEAKEKASFSTVIDVR